MNFRDYPELLRTVEKPGRYTGGELYEIRKDPSLVDTRVAFCFPDTYDIGMSNLGMRILYECLNAEEGVACERVYAPGWIWMPKCVSSACRFRHLKAAIPWPTLTSWRLPCNTSFAILPFCI